MLIHQNKSRTSHFMETALVSPIKTLFRMRWVQGSVKRRLANVVPGVNNIFHFKCTIYLRLSLNLYLDIR